MLVPDDVAGAGEHNVRAPESVAISNVSVEVLRPVPAGPLVHAWFDERLVHAPIVPDVGVVPEVHVALIQ